MKRRIIALSTVGLFLILGSNLAIRESLRHPDFSPLRGFIEALTAHNPARFNTYMNASRLALETRSSATNKRVLSSLDPKDVRAGIRLDGWGRPYCVLKSGDRIAVFSGGAQGLLTGNCSDVRPMETDIPSLPLNVMTEYPSGILVVVLQQHT